MFPKKSLISNIGQDGSGTHSSTVFDSPFRVSASEQPIFIDDIPIAENQDVFNLFSKTLGRNRKNNLKSYYYSLKSFIRRLLDIDAR